MPSSMNWADGSAGGTPLTAANLNKLMVTADVATAGTPTGDGLRTALDARYVRPQGCKTVWLGDSITNYSGGLVTANGVTTQGFTDSKGLHAWANVLLGHAMDAINAGKGGDWTQGMIDRFAADVAAYDPALVIVLGGTNDISNAVTTATTIGNLTTLYQKSLALGARVVACTIPPNSVWTTAQCQQALTINAWIRSYCRTTRGMFLADIGAAVADPATTYQYLTGHTVEGTHPNSLGASKMGRVLARALTGLVPAGNDSLGLANGEPGNLLANPLFVGSGTSLPASWDASGGLGSSTVGYVTSTDGLAVPWLRLTVPNGQNLTIQQNLSLGGPLVVGSRWVFAVEIAVDSQDPAPAANTQAVTAALQSYNGSSFNAKGYDLYWDGSYVNALFPGSGGVLMTTPLTVPADSVVVQAAVTFAGGGVYRLRRSALRSA